MSLESWGKYPRIKNNVYAFYNTSTLKSLLDNFKRYIPFGNGRSYGDSALSDNIIHTKFYDNFLSFDKNKGILHVQSGVILADILKVIVPEGWFLKVTPGTKLITIGGAIASDVHGKNHHVAGCFSESVIQLSLMLPSGEVVICSKKENIELFYATCGGMGLTGIIIDAVISLKKINSKFISQTTIKTNNLKETFEVFEQHKDHTYSVAWIDCLAKNNDIGRSLVMLGDFCDDQRLAYKTKKKINIPINFPAFSLNSFTVKLFNFMYYRKVRQKISIQKVDIDTFFYPLDAIKNWNRIYGNNGFLQYQFILPKNTSLIGLEHILNKIADAGKGSFLAVLKLYGPANDNYLSFPLEGYSLALDFKIEDGLFGFLDELDQLVVEYGGRIYLAKDSRVKQSIFELGYPNIEKFRALRKAYKMDEKFSSVQSERVGI